VGSIARRAAIANDRAMTDPRVELESKVAMLEHTVDALSGELAAQQKQIEMLQASLEALIQQHKRARNVEPIEPHDSRPPHWGG
jgi:uncharacterized coiled-coil protein SlyX